VSGSTFASLSLHLGDGTHIDCHTYPDKPGHQPILCIDSADIFLRLCVRGDKWATQRDVDNARALVKAAGVYLAEVERLHAEAPTEITPDNPDIEASADASATASPKPGSTEAA